MQNLYSTVLNIIWEKHVSIVLPSHSQCSTVKRPRHILLAKVQISPGPGLILHGHFQQPHVAVKNILCLLKLSMQNESGPKGYPHFYEQDVMWSFYSVFATICTDTLRLTLQTITQSMKFGKNPYINLKSCLHLICEFVGIQKTADGAAAYFSYSERSMLGSRKILWYKRKLPVGGSIYLSKVAGKFTHFRMYYGISA